MLGWDMRTQYSSFYENLKTMFLEMKNTGSLPFYSWSAFLGNNFWGSKLFYYHDIFDYLSLLIFPNFDYNRIIMLQTLLKLGIAGVVLSLLSISSLFQFYKHYWLIAIYVFFVFIRSVKRSIFPVILYFYSTIFSGNRSLFN